MRIHVALTGPPRVILARSDVDLGLPGATCTLAELLAALSEAEPRIARYLRGDDGQPPSSLRPLLNDHLLEPDIPIPDGATVTLLYAMAGGSA
jgi:sulfur transfer ThiS family protein